MGAYKQIISPKTRAQRYRAQLTIINAGISSLRTLAKRRDNLFNEKKHTAGFIDAELTDNLVDIKDVLAQVHELIDSIRSSLAGSTFAFVYLIS